MALVVITKKAYGRAHEADYPNLASKTRNPGAVSEILVAIEIGKGASFTRAATSRQEGRGFSR
jgi:hypothetical protein